MHTPWGAAQTQRQLGDGVIQVSTASHGGIHLSPTRNAHVHKAWRDRQGWYEEDSDWAVAALTFPNLFTADQAVDAHRLAKEWMPDQYEQVFGVPVLPAESYIRREQIFYRDNADRFVATAAWGHRNYAVGRVPVPPGMVGVVARRGGRGNPGGVEEYFLVPESEYAKRDTVGFVIDEEFHGDWPPASADPDADGLVLVFTGGPKTPYTEVVDGRKVPSTWPVYVLATGERVGEVWRNRAGRWTAYARPGGAHPDGIGQDSREAAAAAPGWRIAD